MNLRCRILATGLALTVAVGVLLTATVPSSLGAYTARLTNSQNTVTTNPYFTCTAASTGLGAALAWPLDDAGVAGVAGTARDVSGNSRTGLYTIGGVTYRQTTSACPRDKVNSTSYNIALNGSTGYLSSINSFPFTNTFTESIWFNTTTTRGGKIIGFGNQATGASVDYDRQIWMANDGTLNFAVFPNDFRQIASTQSYNDGAWHHVVASLGANGMRLYVDGAQVAVDTTTTTAQTYRTNGMYLRVGYDNLDAWYPNPTSYYFQGSLRFADYFPTTLTAAQITQLFQAGAGV